MFGGVVFEELAAVPPGLGLSAALAGVDVGSVPNDRMLAVLRAQYRQLCHEQARMAAVVAELGRCERLFEPGEVARMAAPDEYSAEEARAALRWTRRAADAEHDLAEGVVHGLPLVFAAWLAGEIDRPRVAVFDRYLLGLPVEHVEGVCRVAVPRAPRLTTGQLAALLRRMVIAVDPDAAERWYRRGIRERDVTAVMEPDGTVVMSANGLPADDAEAACARLQELAGAAKRAGHPGLIGQIRCDLFLGMLDGRFHHMTRDEIITALIAGYARDQWDPAGPVPEPPAVIDLDDEPAAHRHAAAAAAPGTAGDASDTAEATTVAGAPVASATADAAPVADATPPDERMGIEIRIALSTMLGLDDLPADLPGLGPLIAPDARDRVAAQRRAEWRFAVVDAEGKLVADGITRRRPASARWDGPHGGIVEIHVPEALLAAVIGGAVAAGEWAGVIADIAAQHARRVERAAERDACAQARLPSARLRRHTEIRDRACTFPGCRHPARTTDKDHTREHSRGGPTVAANLGPTCPHDHAVKHRGGWWVEQPEPGTFVWHSPLGGTYRSSGERFLPPMPDPQPVQLDDLFDLPRQTLGGPILLPPAHRMPPERPPPADPDTPPPF